HWNGLGMQPHFSECEFPWWQPSGSLPVIEFASNVITRPAGFHAWSDGQPPDGLVLAVLIGRCGKWVSRAWLRGFAPNLPALSTTYNTTTHLLAIGRDLCAMRRAVACVSRMGGGIATADGWEFPLPIAGMMSPGSFAETVAAQTALERRVRDAGFPFGDV